MCWIGYKSNLYTLYLFFEIRLTYNINSNNVNEMLSKR